jgi:hypothetical protein
VALELGRDRLDERIVLELIQDLAPNFLDELEELFGVVFRVVDEEHVREDVGVSFVEFVEIQDVPRRGLGVGRKFTKRTLVARS